MLQLPFVGRESTLRETSHLRETNEWEVGRNMQNDVDFPLCQWLAGGLSGHCGCHRRTCISIFLPAAASHFN